MAGEVEGVGSREGGMRDVVSNRRRQGAWVDLRPASRCRD
jgi:hypothetical protein